MDVIKTYQEVNKENHESTFSVDRMDRIYAVRKGKPDEPHRHNFYTVLLVENGSGKHNIDFHEFELGKRQIFFVAPGQVHQIIEETASKGFVFTFSEQFLIDNRISREFISEIHVFETYGYSPPIILSENQFESLKSKAESIEEVYVSNMSFKNQALASWLRLFLIESFNACNQSEAVNQSVESGAQLFRSFKRFLEKYYATQHQGAYYASALNVTTDYLNRVSKLYSGKTTKEHIQSRITVEAKRMLYFTDFSAKQIAFELGFEDASNFSSFFKKCVGVSPSQYREKGK